jgi:hypothetical protein
MGVLDQAQQGAGGGSVTPQLAEAAAAAGAPPPAADQPEAGAPPAGAPPQPGAGAPPAGAPPQPGAGAPPGGASPAAGNTAEVMAKYMQQGDPREQEEYERAMRALVKVLYSNDDTANAIVDQVSPDDLVGSTSKVSMLFLKELDRKINMDEAVIASITQEIVERVAELAEARHQVQFAPTDMEKIMGATWEGVQTMYGNEDTEGFANTVRSMDPNDMSALKQQHDAILAQE